MAKQAQKTKAQRPLQRMFNGRICLQTYWGQQTGVEFHASLTVIHSESSVTLLQAIREVLRRKKPLRLVALLVYNELNLHPSITFLGLVIQFHSFL